MEINAPLRRFHINNQEEVMRKKTVTALVVFVVMACFAFGFFMFGRSYAETAILSTQLEEKGVATTIPISYGALTAASGNRMYFVDSEYTIRVVAFESGTLLGRDVYVIKRSQ